MVSSSPFNIMALYNIKPDTEGDPYAACISDFIARQFRGRTAAPGELLNLLTTEILGTGQVRYGPKPSPEFQVAMRQIISHYTALGEPIPVVSPWGSEKPDGSSIDIAELMAIRVMEDLNERVKHHYSPGMVFNVRLEDASAPHLFHHRADKAREEAAYYTKGFSTLTKVLGVAGVVRPWAESSFITEEKFNETADEVLPVLLDYVKGVYYGVNHDILRRLAEEAKEVGWSGGMYKEVIEIYLGNYARLYPGMPIDAHLEFLARYYAGSLSRKKLGLTGEDPKWSGKSLQLAFYTPVKGTEHLYPRRLHYRTIPSIYTSNHIAPWRGKGYLKINNDNDAIPKIASFAEQLPYNPYTMHIESADKTLSVCLRADYIVDPHS